MVNFRIFIVTQKKHMKNYPTNLTDNQWKIIENFLVCKRESENIRSEKFWCYQLPFENELPMADATQWFSSLQYWLLLFQQMEERRCLWGILLKIAHLYQSIVRTTGMPESWNNRLTEHRPDECPSKIHVQPKRWITIG